eukprot:1150190-Pelagomonas_calceolata.AAC.4
MGCQCFRRYLPKLQGPGTCAVYSGESRGKGAPMLLGKAAIWDGTMNIAYSALQVLSTSLCTRGHCVSVLVLSKRCMEAPEEFL